MADRCYCPEIPESGNVVIQGDEGRHLARVRRCGPGDWVEIFDGRGIGASAQVVKVGKDEIELALSNRLPDRVPTIDLTLATAVPKGDRFDWLVEKATELGVTRLVPLLTARSSVDPRAAKLDRLRRGVVEACKQCGRNRLMQIEPIATLSDYLRAEACGVRLLAHPGVGVPIGGVRIAGSRRAALAIGPEGGFEPSELAAAREQGWTPVDLGPTLLRIETAGIAACAAVFALASIHDE